MQKVLIIAMMVLAFWSCNRTPKDSYELVWSDEFDYEGLPDTSKWSYDTIGNAWGWGNHELEYYTANRLENAEVSNGTLKIRAIKEPWKDHDYTSARIITKEKGDWLYGRFEIRAKLPDGKGLWPAIWTLSTDWEYGGWPRSGEIDIMENVGYDPDTIVGTVHTEAYNHSIGTQRGKRISVPDNRTEFHVYGMEWDSTSVSIFVDDTTYFTFNKEADDPKVWPFNKRNHLLLNLAVGGDWGGKYGVDEDSFPATFEVDYVRIYQKRSE